MDDIANILEVGGISAEKAQKSQSSSDAHFNKRNRALPKEVMELLGGRHEAKTAALPPAIPSITPAFNRSGLESRKKNNNNIGISTAASVKVGNKRISTKKVARKWMWAPFASSARTDGLLLRHWVRAEVEYPDYPYARFDIHLDPVTYTSEEYELYLRHEEWTKSETDELINLVRRYELRWPVIYDRWLDLHYSHNNTESDASSLAKRKIEDLQHRYYNVAATITQTRITQETTAEIKALTSVVPGEDKSNAESLLMDTATARAIASSEPQNQPLVHTLGTGTSNKVFGLTYERDRRAHMEILWNRTKDEELEEAELRKELRVVEAQLRKLKKNGGHIVAANGKGSNKASPPVDASVATSWSQSSRSVPPTRNKAAGDSHVPTARLDQSFASAAPVPMAETPYLQSGRLDPPAKGGRTGLSKSMLTRMDVVLTELKISENPIPTKRVCDLFDSVRKDIVTLLTLQKTVLQKEGQVQSKRLKLARLGGVIRIANEDMLLGPSNSSSTTSSVVLNATAASRGKGPRGGKTKTTSAVGSGKAKTSPKSRNTSAEDVTTKAEVKDNAGGTKQIRKNPVKRKRKVDAKSMASSSINSSGIQRIESTSTLATRPAEVNEVKATGKKRARKNAP